VLDEKRSLVFPKQHDVLYLGPFLQSSLGLPRETPSVGTQNSTSIAQV